MVSFTLRPFNDQRKNPNQGGFRILSGLFGETNKLWPLPGIQPQFLRLHTRCVVTGLTELSRLLQCVVMSPVEYNDKQKLALRKMVSYYFGAVL
jgi:hypothetical protein